MRSTVRSCTRCACGEACSLVSAYAPRHLLVGLVDAPFELDRADDRAAHAAHEIALKPVRGRDGDHVTGLASLVGEPLDRVIRGVPLAREDDVNAVDGLRSEEHTSELQSQSNLVCRLLLEKKKKGQLSTAPHVRCTL